MYVCMYVCTYGGLCYCVLRPFAGTSSFRVLIRDFWVTFETVPYDVQNHSILWLKIPRMN